MQATYMFTVIFLSLVITGILNYYIAVYFVDKFVLDYLKQFYAQEDQLLKEVKDGFIEELNELFDVEEIPRG